MKILGIDPGTTAVGYAMVSPAGMALRLHRAGLIDIPRAGGVPKQLLALGRSLESIIRELKPEALAIERLFFAKNVKTALAVAEARGVILLTAARLGLRVYEYTPLEVKIAVSGYGRAPKAQVAEMTKRLTGSTGPHYPDDVSDAIAIAITALAREGRDRSGKGRR